MTDNDERYENIDNDTLTDEDLDMIMEAREDEDNAPINDTVTDNEIQEGTTSEPDPHPPDEEANIPSENEPITNTDNDSGQDDNSSDNNEEIDDPVMPPENPSENGDQIVVLPPVDTSKLAGELRDLPVAEVIDTEDYVIINKNKDILQVRFGDLLAATMQALQYEHSEFPDANKLTELISSMIRKQNNIKSADIRWDGDNHKEYGTVRGILMYIMDSIDRLGGNISGTSITINPDGDTPQNVIEDLNGINKLSGVLNYIYTNYRREDTAVPGNMVTIDTSRWKNKDLKVTSDTLSANEASRKLYDYVTTELDKSAKVYYQNQAILDLPIDEGIDFELGHYFINVPDPTRLDLTVSLEIFCRIPGTIIIDVYYDSTKVFSLKDAFATGYHTANYIKTMVIDAVDSDNIGHKISFRSRYYIDTTVTNVLVPASIDIGGMLSIIEGQRISLREGEE